ncbi:MAG: glycosyltransferase 87 family protein [Chloroflexi bacterium]|nr:glycosyltransferase 87 family protein [Chloroflexota bacterium]
MLVKRSGYVLIGLGLLAIIFSLGAELIGIGKGGIQAAQLSGAEAGFFVLVGGAALVVAQRSGKFQSGRFFTWVGNFVDEQPLIIWVVAGFLLAYLLFFIAPMFLNSRLQFQYFYRYLPDTVNLGVDLRQNTHYTRQWLVEGKSPYADNFMFFPPFINLFLAPLLLLGYPTAYYFLLGLEILSYFGLALLLPLLHNLKRELSIVFFFFLTGLFSYGMQFELERGQFNLIAFFLCLFAVYIYHYHEDFRYFAYLFFALSIQLKLYPLIFIVMFIKDWRDWRNNLIRMAGLGAFNIGMLFIIGYAMFLGFFRSLTTQIYQVGAYGWIGNNSIKAFVYNLTQEGFGLFSGSRLEWIRQNSQTIEILLMGFVALCLGSIIVSAYLRKENGFNPYLLMTCTIGAMIIPAVSNDYKLSILAAPMAILFCNLDIPQNKVRKYWLFLLAGLASFAYSVTLYPFKYRPDLIANSLPPMLVILVAVTIAYHLREKRSPAQQ